MNKKLFITSIVFLLLIIGGGIFIYLNQKDKGQKNKPGTAEDRAMVEKNIKTLVEERPNFERIVSDSLKQRESVGNKATLEESQKNQKGLSEKYKIENLRVYEDTASCTTIVERVIRNSKTGFTAKIIENNFIRLEKEGSEWKVVDIQVTSTKTEILKK